MPTYVPDPSLLPAEIVDLLGTELSGAYRGIEAQLIQRLRDAVPNKVPDLTVQLKTIQRLRADAQRLMSATLDPGAAERVIGLAAAAGGQSAIEQLAVAPLLRTKDVPGLPPGAALRINQQEARAIAALTLDLHNKLDNMNLRILRYSEDAYQHVIANILPSVLTGTTTLRDAQQRAVSDFLARGITGFVDKAGKNWTIGTYAEMATRTGALRAWNDASVFQMQEQGINLVAVIIGNDACPFCGAWSGKVLSTDGTPAGNHSYDSTLTPGTQIVVHVDATLDEARAQNFNHPNCRCALVAYFPGLSIPGAETTYDPVKEKEREDLRAMERNLRRLKLEEAAELNPDEKKRIKAAIRDQQAALRKHVADTGLLRQPDRENLRFTRPNPLPPRFTVPRPPPRTGGFAAAGVTRDSLLRELNSGPYTIVKELGGGKNVSGGVFQVRLADGTLGVVKTPTLAGIQEVHSEILASHVAEALGIDYPVVQVPSGHPLAANGPTILSKYIQGETGQAYWAPHIHDPISDAAFDRLATDLDGGRELGLLDYLIQNVDRHEYNWMVVNKTAVLPIDNSLGTWRDDGLIFRNGPFTKAALRPSGGSAGSFTAPLRPKFGLSLDPDFTAAELQRYRSKLIGKRAEFIARSREDWYDAVLANLDRVIQAVTP